MINSTFEMIHKWPNVRRKLGKNREKAVREKSNTNSRRLNYRKGKPSLVAYCDIFIT